MHQFKKEERLSSRNLILRLLNKGSSFLLYPFRVTVLLSELPGPYPAQVMLSVSKRRFRKAASRNRIRRLIREAYRKNKSEHLYSFLQERKLSMALLISYVGNEILPAAKIEKKLILVFKRLQEEYDQKGT